LDDFSRFIIAWELCTNMRSDDVEKLVHKALQKTGLAKDQRPKLLSDNGSCYIARDLKDFVQEEKIVHIHGKPYHPQTQGKIERYHRSMKNIIKLENYYFPEELERQIAQFIEYYNNERYHESLQNLTPADVFFGRDQEILARREMIKEKSIRQRRELYLERKLTLL
jgi:putative transposase